ncbi:flavin-containing monooxygenase FMO [Fimicolochytrium jonesii]|uniref:flavin-containing monooxygenase FMO n=1 Tax=Fimicolochytrium jonesii TaxID=1396493 RepID=UPI0022FDDD5F|nr:flavin-containing monooxygenase FMO [Fimicolochytrium jonesii]KAI8825900.1 flavin-containing monooxygenase FMO [Fimicolochytrium jonesii]
MDFKVAVIGAGFGGVCAGVKLKEQLKLSNFTIYEKSYDVGGTWHLNTYPGCACDVESHLYSFSFQQKPDWTEAYASQPEIHQYLRTVVKDRGLTDHVQFGTEVVKLAWDGRKNVWHLSLKIKDKAGNVRLEETTANVVIGAVGPLHRPHYPEIPGFKDFKGKLMHTAEWDNKVDLKGKRVAVIGNGASGAQVVPELAPIVDKLTVFQRTASWISPRNNFRHSGILKFMFRYVPFLQRFWRFCLYVRRDILWYNAFKSGSPIARLLSHMLRSYLKQEIPDDALRAKLTPDYDPGCKRIVVSDAYLPAMRHPSTRLVTESIVEITPNGIMTSDKERHDLDVIVVATGFLVQESFNGVEVIGKDGLTLQRRWSDSLEAYLGMTVSEFPNLYFLMGPHTGLGHSSVITMIECQMNHITQLLKKQILSSAATLTVRPSALKAFEAEMDGGTKDKVWQLGHCQSWYKNSSGRITALWPYSVFYYWWRTRSVRWADYELQ